ncbi:MAG: glucose 1-dehydrogenase [Dehalococcoidia bacterium]|nr:glucose 1-dehydrogenase [Dehalococcoidia bacterium]
MGRLDGKVAIISGGAKGQGAVETELFAMEGAKVIFGDILDDEGKKVEAKIAELGGDVEYIHLDVTSEDDWQHAVDRAESKYGKLDILVNNAGISMRHSDMDVSSDDWDTMMDVNAKGVFLGVKYAIPAMQRAGGGSIVNISSIAGIMGRPLASPAYSASKGAVRVFTKSTAGRFAGEGIRSNSIHPGPIDTDMIRSATNSVRPETRVGEIPIGRLGQPEDIAYGALYLASDESSFVTGSELVIDGGVSNIRP